MQEDIQVTPDVVVSVQWEGTSDAGSGSIYTDCDWGPGGRPPEWDGVESLLLSMAQEGIPLNTPAMREALDTTLQAILTHCD